MADQSQASVLVHGFSSVKVLALHGLELSRQKESQQLVEMENPPVIGSHSLQQNMIQYIPWKVTQEKNRRRQTVGPCRGTASSWEFIATFLSFDSKEPLDVVAAVSRISQGRNLADSGYQESWAAGAT
jgi:hypothetical protein